MKRFRSTKIVALAGAGIATAALAAAVIATAAFAVPAAGAISTQTASGKLRLTITEQGHIVPYPPAGTFVLEGPAGRDSGASSVSPGEGRAGVQDGQSFQRVQGTDYLTGKKGDLVVKLTGISIDVGTNLSVEYGTWRIFPGLGTGTYKSWRGGGRWAASGTDRRYSIRFEGLVTP